MPVTTMKTISGADQIVDQDRINHVRCRLRQFLAYVHILPCFCSFYSSWEL